jgi:penicillin G amidase
MNIVKGKCLMTFCAAALVAFLLCSTALWAENIKIVRDDYGVPHIYGSTTESLFFGQGYVMAEDRLFQLEMCRLAASGKLSEVMGEKFLDYDKVQRRDIYSDPDIQKLYLTLPEAQKKAFSAFASGINSYIREARELPDRKLSREFRTMNLKPTEWRAEDVIRVYLNSYWTFFDSDQELKNAALYRFAIEKYGDVEGKNIFEDVVWKDDPQAKTTAPQWAPSKKEKGSHDDYKPSADIERLSREYGRERQMARDTLKKLAVPYKAGSYALLVSGKKTTTGNPMLLGGPQVGFGLPSYLYEVGLHGKDLEGVGCSYVGTPGLLVGQNKDLTWTTTFGSDNQVDYFAEKLNPKNQKQYWYKGKWVDMEKESFYIKVKDKKDVFYEVYRTIHGPVIAYDMKDPLNQIAYAKSWAFKNDRLENWNAGHRVLLARNADEFFNAVRTAPYSMNWFAADRKGDIYFMHSGRIPLRAAEVDPRLPTDGTGKCDWKGFVPPSDLPQAKNPASGFFVNWNNKPAPAWNNGEGSILWGSQNRVNLFYGLLGTPEIREVSFQDLKDFDRIISTTNIYAPEIKPLILQALATHEDPEMKEAYRLLRDWNNRYEDRNKDGCYDDPGALIFDIWWPILIKDIFADDLGEHYTFACNLNGAPLILRVLKKEGSLHHDYLNGKDPLSVMADSMKKALKVIVDKQGKDPSKWLKKVAMEKFEPMIPASVDIPMGGGEPISMPSVNRGSAIQIVEASKIWVKGVNVAPPGISGFISGEGKHSYHFNDQLNLYLDGRYKDMLFYPEDVQHHTETTKLLEVK